MKLVIRGRGMKAGIHYFDRGTASVIVIEANNETDCDRMRKDPALEKELRSVLVLNEYPEGLKFLFEAKGADWLERGWPAGD